MSERVNSVAQPNVRYWTTIWIKKTVINKMNKKKGGLCKIQLVVITLMY